MATMCRRRYGPRPNEVGLRVDRLAVGEVVRKREHVRRGVKHADVDRPGFEDAPDPLAHQVDDRLELELLGEAALDLVDHGKLGGPVSGLAEEPGVFEGYAHARRDRADDALVALAERIRLGFAEHDDADRLIAGEDRDP